MKKKRGSLSSSLTTVVGGMLVGLDEQLLRATPRAEILVERGKALRGLSAEGGTLEIGLPDGRVLVPSETPDVKTQGPSSGA